VLQVWNWVLEMYGFALATFRTGQHVGSSQLDNLVAHPPFDEHELAAGSGQPYYLLHLTYPMRYNAAGACCILLTNAAHADLCIFTDNSCRQGMHGSGCVLRPQKVLHCCSRKCLACDKLVFELCSQPRRENLIHAYKP
jgi:ribosomal protein L24E